jgi:hypothetical protein
VFFAKYSDSAAAAAAAESLKKTNSEYNKLLNKKEKINKGILRQTFSEDEENKLKKLRDDAIDNIYKLYFERYPIIEPSPTSRLFREAPLSKPQNGDTVALNVNWSIDSTYTSFLTDNSTNQNFENVLLIVLIPLSCL